MVARLRLAAILGVFVVLLGGGFLYLRGPKPVIEIKAERLWSIGAFNVEFAGFKIVEDGIAITNTLFTSWFVVAFLIIVAVLATRKLTLIPSGWQNFIEAAIEALYGLVQNTVGDRHARRFFPVIATIFLYIIISNWFALLPVFNAIGKVEQLGPEEQHFHEEAVVFEDSGIGLIMPGAKELEFEEIDEARCEEVTGAAHEECLVDLRAEAIAAEFADEGVEQGATVGLIAPYFRSVNTDLMSPLSLAIASAIFVEWWGISTLGFVAYGSKFFNFGRLFRGGFMGAIDFFVGILEFIAELARLISFSFRLFGNMLAGEILLLIMTFLIPLFLALPFYGLELFVGAIQAFVFAMLTLVFGALAVAGHGGEHGDHVEVTDAGEAPAH